MSRSLLQAPMGTRCMKALLTVLVGAFALLVAVNNVTDYGSNFMFVQHVLAMDTTFEGNRLMWRAIEAEWFHHLAYWLIIACEFSAGVLCTVGAIAMWRSRHQPAAQFQPALMLASWGLVLGIALWFGGFMTVGAEWFLMWQSDAWNGQEAAFRFIMCLFGCLLFLHLPEPPCASAQQAPHGS
ncbi:DUF2165 family protein [Haliea sp. E17]|uniref:DUF2165 family protein n=1 Tax=Haliea sp. E17 TaxID=3401576 RepID=UPI003AAFBD9A